MSATRSGITEQVLAYRAPDPQLEVFEPAKDRAFFADPEKKALLAAAKQVRHLTPYIGTELVGVQLSQLNETQKDELALLVAEVGNPMSLGKNAQVLTDNGVERRSVLPSPGHHAGTTA